MSHWTPQLRLMSVQELGKPITVAMPLQLMQDWSFIDKQEGLHQHMMKQLDGSAMGTEQYIKHVLES